MHIYFPTNTTPVCPPPPPPPHHAGEDFPTARVQLPSIHDPIRVCSMHSIPHVRDRDPRNQDVWSQSPQIRGAGLVDSAVHGHGHSIHTLRIVSDQGARGLSRPLQQRQRHPTNARTTFNLDDNDTLHATWNLSTIHCMQVVAKSTKLLPTMAMGTLLLGRRFNMWHYLAASCLCLGLAGFAFTDGKDKEQRETMLIGILLLG